jgi:hypothetical protein
MYSILLKVIALERGIVLLKNQVELYKSDNLAERSPDNGDPFPLLAALKPDEVRSCTFKSESTFLSLPMIYFRRSSFFCMGP